MLSVYCMGYFSAQKQNLCSAVQLHNKHGKNRVSMPCAEILLLPNPALYLGAGCHSEVAGFVLAAAALLLAVSAVDALPLLKGEPGYADNSDLASAVAHQPRLLQHGEAVHFQVVSRAALCCSCSDPVRHVAPLQDALPPRHCSAFACCNQLP